MGPRLDERSYLTTAALARLAVLIFLVDAAGCTLALVEGRSSVQVLVYNIHAGKDAAQRPNLDEVAALIRSTAADIVLLQEVDRGTRRSGGVDQLQALIDSTGFAGAFGRTLDYDGGQYGLAALSRRGFGYQETVPLPVSPVQARAGGSHEPRGALITVAHTDLGGWQAITTHLDASTGDEYRRQEVDRLRDILTARRATGMPLVLGGDMNATPDSAVVKTLIGFGLRDAWPECGVGDGLTYPADKPVKRIDYLFLMDTLHCTDARVVETTISDHRPLVATVTMRPRR